MRVILIKTTVTLFGAIGLSASAAAADLAVPITTMPPNPFPPVFTWTGPYAGVNLGYAAGRPHTRVSWAGWPDTVTPNAVFLNESGLRATKKHKSSFTGGGQLGYNYQWGSMILGLEADLNSIGHRRSVATTASYQDAASGQSTDTAARGGQALHWFATVRPRLGWAFGERLMVYGTGGLAVARASQRIEGVVRTTAAVDPAADPAGAVPTAVTSHFGVVGKNGSGYRLGWALGAGAEYAVTDNLALKGEFLHVNVRGRSHVAASQEPATLGVAFVSRNSTVFQVIKAGVNYRF